ncbi:MAG: hypothetical protein JRH18_17225 [Deltaproteobacteria bacterium]|nr:hypothetical protein [Deltaproteobacteria bacterium]MBW2153399.1 hypothetical protein [Deltaproteobacteria bacterium]
MANLFWKKDGETKSLLSTPFKTEEEFEKEIFSTQEILEDIFLIKRQIRGGNKTGIPDLVGIDNDGNICIIEMKNVTVDASIIPQVLQYAFWAETNPDSIKSLWLECDNKPDDIAISWDSFQVRIIVIAPSILRSTLDIVDKINYPVDLIEVKRWVEGKNSLYLVNKLEADPKATRIKPTSGMQIYDEEFYKREYNKKSAIEFIKYAKELEKFIAKQDWNLELKFNKHYCGFKAGFFNAFGIQWVGTKTFAFFFKLSEDEAKSTNIKLTKYESQWKQAVYYIVPGKTKIEEYEPLFELAYKKLTGN